MLCLFRFLSCVVSGSVARFPLLPACVAIWVASALRHSSSGATVESISAVGRLIVQVAAGCCQCGVPYHCHLSYALFLCLPSSMDAKRLCAMLNALCGVFFCLALGFLA